jgi:hypothetical protein
VWAGAGCGRAPALCRGLRPAASCLQIKQKFPFLENSKYKHEDKVENCRHFYVFFRPKNELIAKIGESL